MGSALIVSHDMKTVDEWNGFGLDIFTPPSNRYSEPKAVWREGALQSYKQFLVIIDFNFSLGMFPINIGPLQFVCADKCG